MAIYNISNGVTSTKVILTSEDYMYVTERGYASKTTIDFAGIMHVSSGGTASDTTILESGIMYVSSGGTAADVTMSGGSMYVSGGVASLSYVSNGVQTIFENGIATSTFVYEDGRMQVSSGGSAVNNTVSGGLLIVSSGGFAYANDISDEGYLRVSGGSAQYVLLSNGSMFVTHNGSAQQVTVSSGGWVGVSSGGTVTGTVLAGSSEGNRGGAMFVSGSGAVAVLNSVFEGGRLHVRSGGVLGETIVHSGGSMHVSSGGTHTGSLSIIEGADVIVDKGGVIDFDLTTTQPDRDAQAKVNKLSYISGTPSFTLTVNEIQDGGIYNLASGAAGFDKTITVLDASGEKLGTLTVGGESLASGADLYTLKLYESTLRVEVEVRNIFTGDLTSATKDITSDWYASAVNVNEKGILNILNGGIANKTQINATDGLAYRCGKVRVYDGGVANSTTVNASGEFLVSSGGTATNTTLYDGMTVCSGGMAENISMLADCILHVSGGTAAGVDIAAGNLDVDSGGTATGVRASRGTEILLYGGIVEDLNTEGSVYVQNLHANDFGSAIVSNASLGNGARMTLDRGGIASDTVVDPGVLDIHAGGTAASVIVSAGGSMLIASDGKLTGKVTLQDGCFVSAGMGAIIDFDISAEAPENDRLYNDLSLIVTGGDGVPAAGVAADPVYTLTVSDQQENGTYYLAVGADGFDKTISVVNTSGTTLGTLTVDGGPTAVGGATYELSLLRTLLTVTVTGSTNRVFTGDLTDETKDIPSGWLASSVNVNSDGILNILEGGDGDDIAVNSAGTLVVSSGGKAVRIKENGGFVRVKVDAEVEFSPNAFSGLALVDGYSATLHSGTIATATTVNDAGSLYILDGGIAVDTTINKDSDVTVFEGGKAEGMTVNDGGYLDVYGGGTATGIKENGGYVMSHEDSVVRFASNTFSGLVKTAANATVHSGTTAVATTLDKDGTLEVFKGGVASATTVNAEGYLYVSSGGVAKDVTVNDNGELYINEAAKMTGVMTFASDAVVSISTEAVVDFDISALSPSNATLLNNFALFEEMPQFTLTVSDTQANGSYSLAGGAAEFNETITIMNTLGAAVGTLTVGGFGAVVGDRNYMLEIADNLLTVTVSDAAEEDTVAPIVSGVRADETDPTDQAVTVTASFTDNSGVVHGFYRIGDGEWTVYPADGAGVTVEENATLYFKAVDEAGNESEVAEYKVENIDKVPPTITVTPSSTQPAASVTLTADYADNVGLATTIYKIGDGEWTRYDGTGITLTKNATVYFRAFDTASNETNESYTVANIRTIDPERFNKPDSGEDDILSKNGKWNDANIKVTNTISGEGEINLDEAGTIEDENGNHNMFGNDGKNKDAGDVAKVAVEDTAQLTFSISSTAAGTFYVYQKVRKNNKDKQVTVGKVPVKANDDTPATLSVSLVDDGSYYVAMIAKSTKKGTSGYYSVNVTDYDTSVYEDADDGGNKAWNTATPIEVGRGTNALFLDTNEIKKEGFSNFVGFSDDIDYAKLELESSAYMSFSLESDGKVKFTLWKQKIGAAGNPTKVTSKSLPAKSGAYTDATAEKFLDTSKYVYYVSMESTDAAKGGTAHYNVSVKSAVFFDPDGDKVNKYVYSNKKLNKNLDKFRTNELTVSAEPQELFLDSNEIRQEGFSNFVGYNDKADYAKFSVASNGDVTFTIETTGTGTGTFAVWRNNAARKKLEALGKVEIKADQKTGTLTLSGLKSGEEYYISMTAKSTKANASGSVFYNVMAIAELSGSESSALAMPETASVASALSMPETDSLADSLAMSADSLNLGQYDTDALAGTSLDPASDKLLGETGSGLLASL